MRKYILLLALILNFVPYMQNGQLKWLITSVTAQNHESENDATACADVTTNTYTSGCNNITEHCYATVDCDDPSTVLYDQGCAIVSTEPIPGCGDTPNNNNPENGDDPFNIGDGTFGNGTSGDGTSSGGTSGGGDGYPFDTQTGPTVTVIGNNGSSGSGSSGGGGSPSTLNYDCMGTPNGTAHTDACGNCVGGFSLIQSDCKPDLQACVPYQQASLLVTDARNPNRNSTGGKILVMVGDPDESRSATFSVSNINTTPYISWSSPSDNGASLTKSIENTEVMYAEIYPSNPYIESGASLSRTPCKTLVGRVTVVPTSESSIEGKIETMNNSIKSIKSVIDNGLGYLTKNNSASFTIDITGTGKTKNVDKYNDGSTSGKFFEGSLGLTATFNLPSFTTPSLEIAPLIYAKATMNIGSISGSGAVVGTYDESKSSPGSISGRVSVSLQSPSFELEVAAGVDKVCSTGISGKATIPQLTYTGDIISQNKQLVLKSTYDMKPISFTGEIFFKTSIFACSKTLYELDVCEVPKQTLPEVILLNF